MIFYWSFQVSNTRFGKATRDRFRRRLPNDARTPTALSLELLRNMGWSCLVTETNMRIPRDGEDDLVFKRDLFGFVDIVCLKPGHGTLGVQTTDRTHLANRVNKIQCSEWFEWMRRAGGWQLHVHGWGPRGVEIVDMFKLNDDGTEVYPTLWSQVLLAKMAKRKSFQDLKRQRSLIE